MTAKTPTKGMGRRDFVKKAAYIAPAILTLTAAPAFAKNGSDHKGEQDSPGLTPAWPPGHRPRHR